MYREGLKGGILLRPGVTPGDLGKIHVSRTEAAATLSSRPPHKAARAGTLPRNLPALLPSELPAND